MRCQSWKSGTDIAKHYVGGGVSYSFQIVWSVNAERFNIWRGRWYFSREFMSFGEGVVQWFCTLWLVPFQWSPWYLISLQLINQVSKRLCNGSITDINTLVIFYMNKIRLYATIRLEPCLKPKNFLSGKKNWLHHRLSPNRLFDQRKVHYIMVMP